MLIPAAMDTIMDSSLIYPEISFITAPYLFGFIASIKISANSATSLLSMAICMSYFAFSLSSLSLVLLLAIILLLAVMPELSRPSIIAPAIFPLPINPIFLLITIQLPNIMYVLIALKFIIFLYLLVVNSQLFMYGDV
ncbi:hypothetical protein SDC9_129631 [bioreactor metagenome]|uniref:Uncharacterized protein n=1 Tax=bioreactor metagenome TaxID=1076179 RepID=A0A645CZD0_9ZZZZ